MNEAYSQRKVLSQWSKVAANFEKEKSTRKPEKWSARSKTTRGEQKRKIVQRFSGSTIQQMFIYFRNINFGIAIRFVRYQAKFNGLHSKT